MAGRNVNSIRDARMTREIVRLKKKHISPEYMHSHPISHSSLDCVQPAAAF